MSGLPALGHSTGGFWSDEALALVLQIHPQVEADEFVAGVQTRMDTLAESEQDGDARVRLLASSFLAIAEELVRQLGDEDVARSTAHQVARIVMDDVVGQDAFLKGRYGIDPAEPERAFEVAAVTFKPRGEAVFGTEFTYEQDILDEERSFVSITKCYFNDFFRRHGRPDLTPIFCEYDTIFTAELSKPQYGVFFDRPTAMGRGDDRCRFQFSRTHGEPTAPSPTEA